MRPVRRSYEHVGCPRPALLRELTEEEQAKYAQAGYEFYEEYPEEHAAQGRLYTRKQLEGCGTVTTMGLALAETYASDPEFYGGTYCSRCGSHFDVGADGEFVWEGTDIRVGT